MDLSGQHNLQILRGLSSNRALMSCVPDGTKVDLWGSDDASGRQEWNFTHVNGADPDTYNIKVVGGFSGDRVFLSCTDDGSVVDLWSSDDGSGRQRWKIIPVDNSPTCSTYLIRVSEGVFTDRRYLSCTPDGGQVNLWNADDGSGRQRWQIQGIWKA